MITFFVGVFVFGFYSCLYALTVRVAARILGYSVTFRRSLVFGGIISPIMFLAVLAIQQPAGLKDWDWLLFQSTIRAASGFPLYMLLIGWFFREHATSASGQILGWRGSIRLSLCAFLLMVLLFGSLDWTITVMH